MQKFNNITGIVAPLNRANVDTDAIIPKQFLKSIERTGYGDYIFDEWRYLDRGEPGMDCSKRPLNQEFPLNFPQYKSAEILLAGPNFGCGSSREHAPWGLLEYGFKVIIAPSFADIFYNNCTKNGILPIVLPIDTVNNLFKLTESISGFKLSIDLDAETITGENITDINFTVEPSIKHRLLQGLDDIALSMQFKDDILAFEQQRQSQQPWIFQL